MQHQKQSPNGFSLQLWFLERGSSHSWSLCSIGFSILSLLISLTSDFTGNYGPGTGVLWTSKRPTRQHSTSYSQGLSQRLQVRKVCCIVINRVMKQEIEYLSVNVVLYRNSAVFTSLEALQTLRFTGCPWPAWRRTAPGLLSCLSRLQWTCSTSS